MNFRLFFGLTCLLVGSGLAAAQEPPASPTQAELERAAELNRQGVAAFKEAHGNQKKLKKAAELLEEGVALGGPTVYASSLTLAHVREGLDEPTAALALVRRLLEVLPPTHAFAKEARVLLCQIRLRHPEPEAAKAAGDRPPFKPSEDDGVVKPVRIAGLDPHYSPEMRMKGQQGQVIFEAVIDREGCVTGIETLAAANRAIERAMKDAVRTWTFLPATLEGKPVAVYYHVSSNFSLSP